MLALGQISVDQRCPRDGEDARTQQQVTTLIFLKPSMLVQHLSTLRRRCNAVQHNRCHLRPSQHAIHSGVGRCVQQAVGSLQGRMLLIDSPTA